MDLIKASLCLFPGFWCVGGSKLVRWRYEQQQVRATLSVCRWFQVAEEGTFINRCPVAVTDKLLGGHLQTFILEP
jgi:hypothetical protein